MKAKGAFEKTVLSLVDHIYAAAGNSNLWSIFLEEYSEAVQGECTLFIAHDFSRKDATIAAAVRADPALLKEYEEHYAPLNEWVNNAGQEMFRTGIISSSDEVITDEVLMQTEFYNDYLRRLGVFYSFGGTIQQGESMSAYITCQRPRNRGRFGDEEKRLLKTLLPHLQRAVQLHQRIAGLEATITEIVDRLPMGVILVDGAGRTLLMNRSAKKIVDQNDGLRLTRAGYVRAAHSVQTETLHSLIRRSAATGSQGGLHPGGALALDRPSLRRPLPVLVTPLRSHLLFPLPGKQAAAAIFVSDPEAVNESADAILRRLFALNLSESKLASLLMQGKSLNEAADALGYTRETARTYMKRILQKTGTQRQAELIRLLWSSPAHLNPVE